MEREIQLGPWSLKPDVIEVRPVYPGTSIRVFDADQFGVRVTLSK
jgi:hypothetical protein